MTKTISIIQSKGGSGKSTLACNLAAQLAKHGHTTLIDADLPQGSSQAWFAMRLSHEKPELLQNLSLKTAGDYLGLMKAAEAAGEASEFVVVDTPPRTAKVTRTALMMSNLILVPCGASKVDLWGLLDTLELLEEAKQTKPINARLVWTKHKANTTLSKELEAEATTEIKLKPLATKMGLRTSYMSSFGNGLSVAETKDPSAKAELLQLTAEILKNIKK